MQGNWSQLDWLKGDGPRPVPPPDAPRPTKESERSYTFAYRPHAGMLVLAVLFFGAGALFMRHLAVTNDRGLVINGIITLGVGGAKIFYWSLAGVCAAFVVAGIFFGIPQIFIPRNVILEPDAITVPGWGLSKKHYRIPWKEIEAVVRSSHQKYVFVRIIHGGRKYAINSGMLPSNSDMETIERYIAIQMAKLMPVPAAG
jgi:hypothetical protein